MAGTERPGTLEAGALSGASAIRRLPMGKPLKNSHLLFLSWVVLSLTLFWTPLKQWASLSLRDNRYSHLILIPVIAGLLVYMERRTMLAGSWRGGLKLAALLALAATGVYLTGWKYFRSLNSTDHIAIMILSLVLMWIAGFVGCYGVEAFRAAAFPLSLLVLMIPIPTLLLTRIISALQQGSAAVLYWILTLAQVPVYRNGLTFSLPGFSIQIARECSGIRSSMALLIIALLASHLFLRAYWRKAVLIAFIAPLVVVKNGLRIATISLLSVYFNRGFLYGKLHHYGGIPFSIISVGLLIPVLWWLQKSENKFLPEGRSQPQCLSASPDPNGRGSDPVLPFRGIMAKE